MATPQVEIERFGAILGPDFPVDSAERDPVLRVSRDQVANLFPAGIKCAYCSLNQHATSLVFCHHLHCMKYFCNSKSTRANRYFSFSLCLLYIRCFYYIIVCFLSHIVHHLRENPDHRDIMYFRPKGGVHAYAGLRCSVEDCRQTDIFQLLYFPTTTRKDIFLMCSYHVFERLKDDELRRDWR
jgi:hypothetical protein